MTDPTTTDRVHTPLLTLVTQDALDSDYAAVAARRSSDHRPRSRVSGATIAGLVAFGILVAVAAVQTNKQDDVTSAGRTELLRRVEARRTALDQAQSEINALRSSIADLNQTTQSLRETVDNLQDTVASLGGAVGFRAVHGPGVRVTIDDAANSGSAGSGIVRDTDLRLAINGLWRAGAEAIAVNGQRVSSLSTPRNSGTVIRMGGVSLSAPYVISAIGDPDDLGPEFALTASGVEFLAIAQSYDMPVEVVRVNDLDLPGSAYKLGTLDYAVESIPVKPEGEVS